MHGEQTRMLPLTTSIQSKQYKAENKQVNNKTKQKNQSHFFKYIKAVVLDIILGSHDGADYETMLLSHDVQIHELRCFHQPLALNQTVSNNVVFMMLI